MCFKTLLHAIGQVGSAKGSYEEYYDAVQARYQRVPFVEADSVWGTFARELDGAWFVYKAVAGVYTTTVIGLLSISGIPSGPVTICLGMICLQASLFSLVYCEVYHCLMPRVDEPLQGFDWLDNASKTSCLSWKAAPYLLSVPAYWSAGATITFFVFVLLEMWISLIGQLAVQSHYPGIVLALTATIEILGGLLQAVYIVAWFAELSVPTGQSSV